MNPLRRAQALLLRRSRLFGIVFFVLVLAGFCKIGEYIVLTHHQSAWDRISDEKAWAYLVQSERAFVDIQRSMRRIATELARGEELPGYLRADSTDRTGLFEYIAGAGQEYGVGVEVYDRHGSLLAWEGKGGPSFEQEIKSVLEGSLVSFVTGGPLVSQLLVAAPVRYEGKIAGALVVRRSIEVKYPLSNKFINREGLSLDLSKQLGVPVEFDFSPSAELKKDGRYLSSILFGIDSTKVGIVSVMRPTRSAYLETIGLQFDRIIAVLLSILIFLSAVAAIGASLHWESLFLRSLALTVVLWLARYGLLWLDFPSSLFETGVFDPSSFASTFGNGLARSIGEMSITTLTLLLNVLFILRFVIERVRRTSPWWHPENSAVRLVLMVASTTFMYLLLRGYGATIRSAVFDSTLSFTDPGVIVPSFELGVMVLNLFAISFCLIVVVVGLTSFNVSLVGSTRRTSQASNIAWLFAGGLIVVASILFALQPTPLMSTPYRLLFGAGILVFTYRLHSLYLHTRPLATATNLLIGFGLSAMFFYPLLDEQVHEKDKERLQTFAAEVVRPVDGWLKFAVDEALKGFSGDETMDKILSGNTDEVEKLAFTSWAHSAISKEGYSCRFSLVDSTKTIVSQFSLGGQSMLGGEISLEMPLPLKKSITVHEMGSGIYATKVYSGSIPLFNMDGKLLGWGVVLVAAGQQSLFRGDSPAILRSVTHETLESFYRPISLSQFRNGILFLSTDTDLPIGHALSATVQTHLANGAEPFVWGEELVDGVSFETLYVQRPGASGDVIALGLQGLGVWWHLFSAVKVLVYYSIVVAVAMLGIFLIRLYQRRQFKPTFRDKLLGALLITAVVPIIALAIYGRIVARERLMDSTQKQLTQEISAVSTSVQQQLPELVYRGKAGFSNAVAEKIAEVTGVDFNVYGEKELLVSSRPELYEAGILDRRLEGNVYANLYIEGKRFLVQTESIGQYQYAVGYAPVLDETGKILCVVSVPSLYRQEELEKEVSGRNALIFGIYAVVLFAIVIIASTFANRIAAPIHRLTEATKRVAHGDLDVTVHAQGVDGEIGELVNAFENMTKDLKRSRAELVQVERELAWKEMAKQVAHEIKNPLTPMKLSLQHLRQMYNDRAPNFSETFDSMSKMIIEQIDALSRIASEFSNFARMPKATLEQMDVNVLVKEAVQLFDQEESVRFEMSFKEQPLLVVADRQELRRAFINIMRNGLQAMNNRGTMVVRTVQDNGFVVIRFQDFGSGIPDDVKERLFQPNFSTKTDGMGLGLAIVKKTIDDLKGTITIDSAVGEGTTVTIRLPVTQDIG